LLEATEAEPAIPPGNGGIGDDREMACRQKVNVNRQERFSYLDFGEPAFDREAVLEVLVPRREAEGELEGKLIEATRRMASDILAKSESLPDFLDNLNVIKESKTDSAVKEALAFLIKRTELLIAKGVNMKSQKKIRDVELADYDPDNLYDILSKRYEDLTEARAIIEQGIIGLKNSKQGDVPITLEDQLQFLLRLFDDINVLYLSNMVLISKLKKRDWSAASSEEQA
jgi:hypothetical protein